MVKVWAVMPYVDEPQARRGISMWSSELGGCCEIVQVHDAERRGVAWAMNEGIRIAKEHGAEHVARIDCGDMMLHGRVDAYRGRPQFCGAYVPQRNEVIGYDDEVPPGDDLWSRRIYSDNQFCASSTIFPVSAWEQAGGYDETLTYCSDWDFHARVQHEVGWEQAPIVGVVACEYPDGLTATANQERRRADRVRVAERLRKLRKGV